VHCVALARLFGQPPVRQMDGGAPSRLIVSRACLLLKRHHTSSIISANVTLSTDLLPALPYIRALTSHLGPIHVPDVTWVTRWKLRRAFLLVFCSLIRILP